MTDTLTRKELKKHLDYDPKTGEFFWVKSGKKRRLNQPAGSVDKTNGYVRIYFQQTLHYAHRLAFLFMTGEIPNEIDHINGIKRDNRFSNLRAVTRKENTHNNPRTRSGELVGVYETDSGKYKVVLQNPFSRKVEYLGTFDTKQDAANRAFRQRQIWENMFIHNREFMEALEEVKMYYFSKLAEI